MLRNLAHNLVWGLGLGLLLAVVCSVLASVGFALATVTRQSLEIRYLPTVGGYFAAGVIGGSLLGVARPVLRYGWGAAIVGGIIVPIAFLAIFSGFEGGTAWIRNDGWGNIRFLLCTTSLAGMYSGWSIHRK